ncbi:MAG TPA: DUF1622 domain-containing protein [Candidatus Angelobacter sp.]|nr:DUF1622 domain-containing protein [Candidatus Angelobacter sp.]
MEEVFRSVAAWIALGIEAAAALLIMVGACEAFYTMFARFFSHQLSVGTRKEVLVRFGVWLLLGLEFELAADIIRTAISPSWNDIGQLAAIATIRTVLNHFLEKDLEKYGESTDVIATAPPARRAA